MRRLGLFLVLMTLTGGSLSAQDDSTILFAESFSENTVDWETEDSSDTFSDIDAGHYVIDRAETDVGWIVAPGFNDWSMAPKFDIPYEVSVDLISWDASLGYMCAGLLTNVTQGYDNYIQYVVCNEGRWVITGRDGYLGGGMIDRCLPLAFDEPLKLTARVWPDYYTLSLNDELIGVVQSPQTPRHGTVGLIADTSYNTDETTLQAVFDNLEVRALTLSQQPDDLASLAYIPADNRLSTIVEAEQSEINLLVPSGWHLIEVEAGIFSLTSSLTAGINLFTDDEISSGDALMAFAIPDIINPDLLPERSGDEPLDVEALAGLLDMLPKGGGKKSPLRRFDGDIPVFVASQNTSTHVVFFETKDNIFMVGQVYTAPGELDQILPTLARVVATMGHSDPARVLTSADPLPLIQTYTSDVYRMTLDIPASWYIEEKYAGSPIQIYSQSCRPHFNIEPGMARMDIKFNSISAFAPGVNPLSATPDEALEAYIKENFGISASNIETVTVNGVDIAYEYDSDGGNTFTHVLSLTEGQQALVMAIHTNPGELPAFLPTALQIVSSTRSEVEHVVDSDLPNRYVNYLTGVEFSYPVDWQIDEPDYATVVLSNDTRRPSSRVEIRLSRLSAYDLGLDYREGQSIQAAVKGYVDQTGLRGFTGTPEHVPLGAIRAHRLYHDTSSDVIYVIPGDTYNLYVYVTGDGLDDRLEMVQSILETMRYRD